MDLAAGLPACCLVRTHGGDRAKPSQARPRRREAWQAGPRSSTEVLRLGTWRPAWVKTRLDLTWVEDADADCPKGQERFVRRCRCT